VAVPNEANALAGSTIAAFTTVLFVAIAAHALLRCIGPPSGSA
jgi:hypothetical protein